MREILFKAKRKDNGEWVEGYVVFCNGKINPGQAYIAPTVSSIIALEDWAGLRLGPFVEVYPETICQYTGLTDKNGVKIFENDVLKYKGKNKYTVKFDYGMFICEGFYNLFFDVPWDAFSEGTEEIEVIGSIHDEED